MMCYSAQPRDIIFLKDHGIFPFVKNVLKNIGKNVSNNLNDKYSQKLIDHAKKSTTGAFKTTSKRAIQKTVKATGDLVGNKISDKITKVSKTLPQNNSETVTIEEEIPR